MRRYWGYCGGVKRTHMMQSVTNLTLCRKRDKPLPQMWVFTRSGLYLFLSNYTQLVLLNQKKKNNRIIKLSYGVTKIKTPVLTAPTDCFIYEMSFSDYTSSLPFSDHILPSSAQLSYLQQGVQSRKNAYINFV